MTDRFLFAESIPGFTLSSRGLQPSDSPTFEQWQHVGDALAQGHGALQWAIGDWLYYGEGRPEWGDGYRAAVARFGKKYQTLLNLKSIARAFPFSRRRENLSWAHHAEVAGLPLEEQDRLLSEAEPEGADKPRLTRNDLRERVKALDPDGESHPPFIALMNKVRTAVDWAAENCRPEDVHVLQSYLGHLSDEVPQMAEPILDSEVGRPHVAHNSGVTEWYTPDSIVVAARMALGGIDLDPASCLEANTVVGAETIFTEVDDGLAQHWSGRIFLNPPYSTDLVGGFIEKLAQHVRAGDVSAAVVVTNNATETTWFSELVSIASAVVFPRGRIRFWRPGGKTGAPLQGQAIAYVGDEPETFLAAFAEIGWGAVLPRGSASARLDVSAA